MTDFSNISDAQTTRDGFYSNDGFSNVSAVKDDKPALEGTDVTTEEVVKALASMPTAWNTGEVITSGTSIKWSNVSPGSVYEYSEFVEGKYYPQLCCIVRLKGVQTGFISSDGEQYLEAIKVPCEDIKADPSKFAAYVQKKEILIAEMCKPARADVDEVGKHIKVQYPTHIKGMQKFFGFHGDGRCAHAHLSPVTKNNKSTSGSIKCDHLHMRWNETEDVWELCHCSSSNSRKRAADDASVFSLVTSGAAAARGGSNSSNSGDNDQGDEGAEYCLSCKCMRDNNAKQQPRNKENAAH
jgi:hypothetical protein